MTDYTDAFHNPIKSRTFYEYVETGQLAYVFRRKGEWVLEHSNGEKIVNAGSSFRKLRPTTRESKVNGLEKEITWLESKPLRESE